MTTTMTTTARMSTLIEYHLSEIDRWRSGDKATPGMPMTGGRYALDMRTAIARHEETLRQIREPKVIAVLTPALVKRVEAAGFVFGSGNIAVWLVQQAEDAAEYTRLLAESVIQPCRLCQNEIDRPDGDLCGSCADWSGESDDA